MRTWNIAYILIGVSAIILSIVVTYNYSKLGKDDLEAASIIYFFLMYVGLPLVAFGFKFLPDNTLSKTALILLIISPVFSIAAISFVIIAAILLTLSILRALVERLPLHNIFLKSISSLAIVGVYAIIILMYTITIEAIFI